MSIENLKTYGMQILLLATASSPCRACWAVAMNPLRPVAELDLHVTSEVACSQAYFP
jgi:hypothetical protein